MSAAYSGRGGTLEAMGGAADVSEIYSFAFDGMDHAWPSWIASVRDTLALREAFKVSQALSECEDSATAVRRATEALEAISAAVAGPRQSVGSKEAAREFFEWFQTTHEAGDLPGIPSGIEPFDLISGGLRPGELTVVCGKPSRGKSVLMLQMAAHSLTSGRSVAIHSLEMMRRQVIGRLVSTIGRVSYGSITQPRNAARGDLQIMARVIREIASGSMGIDDHGRQSIEHIQAEAERIRDANGGLDLLVVDYIQLCDGDRRRGESREQEIARVSSGLKKLAKRLNCPVLTGSQLNDEGKTRESRAIEQDADCLLYIVEDGVKIVKLRDGRRDDVLPLRLNGEFQRFDRFTPEPAEQRREPPRPYRR